MHPTEGMWQEFLDQESDPPSRRELELHLDTCAECRQATAVLEQRRFMMSELLDQLEASGPARTLSDVLSRRQTRRSWPSLIAAAVIAMCVVTAAGATIRAGLFQRAMDWLMGPRPWVQAPAPPPALPAPERASSTGIAFDPSGPVEVAFEEWPRGGEIEIVLRDASKVSVVASEPSGFSVRRGRVVVANRGRSANYRISLPQNVPLASVRVGDRVVFTKRGPEVTTQASMTAPGTYVLSFAPKSGSSP
jgi:anti-sigma factor RsiW